MRISCFLEVDIEKEQVILLKMKMVSRICIATSDEFFSKTVTIVSVQKSWFHWYHSMISKQEPITDGLLTKVSFGTHTLLLRWTWLQARDRSRGKIRSTLTAGGQSRPKTENERATRLCESFTNYPMFKLCFCIVVFNFLILVAILAPLKRSLCEFSLKPCFSCSQRFPSIARQSSFTQDG